MEREESLSKRKRQGVPQDIGGKRARLDRRNERDRARRRTETDRQKEVRLAKRRDRDRARRAASITETQQEKTSRLKHKSTEQQLRHATQTPEERAARQQHKSVVQQQRLAAESLEKRTSRLKQMSAVQQQRLAAETHEARAVRLDHLHQNRIASQHSASQEAHLPLLEQKCVKDKMAKFHKDIAALSSPTCITCMESFPGLKVNSRSECARCSRDKHTPKLYSMANNMNPGPVPSELQVRGQNTHYTII